MDQMNFHKQKLFALIAGAVGLIGCLLPWVDVFLFSVNGLHGLGILVFLGFIGAIACCFLDDRSKPFDGQFKMIAAGCFAGAALLTLIQIIRIGSFLAFGIWITLLAGVAGAVIVYVLKPEQLINRKDNIQP